MKRIFSLILVFFIAVNTSEAQDFSDQLFEGYSIYKEESISKRRIKHEKVISLLDHLKASTNIEVEKVGESIQGRSLNLVSLGEGKIVVFLWSQMHGDEPTATMAIFDILNFFTSPGFENEKELMMKNLRIHFLPMLNPDGAELYQRRNALGIDINRDAVRLQSPEGQTLKRIRDSLDADFGFNLHDQSTYYNAERTGKPATISFLAPAYNSEKDINNVRGDAMKLIVKMNKVLQKFAPGQVGRYNDDFEPRAFGDNIQKWGTSTILIESGGYPDDPEKQEIRKLNFVAILSALYSIAAESYVEEDLSAYETIPNNDRMLFDLKITGLTYKIGQESYILDLGINRFENDLDENSDYYNVGRIVDQGDLSTNYGYKEIDASGHEFRFGKVYPEKIDTKKELEELSVSELLKEGYAYIKVSDSLLQKEYSEYPLNLVSEDFKENKELHPGIHANFFLYKDGKVEFAVINGFLTRPENFEEEIRNSLIFK